MKLIALVPTPGTTLEQMLWAEGECDVGACVIWVGMMTNWIDHSPHLLELNLFYQADLVDEMCVVTTDENLQGVYVKLANYAATQELPFRKLIPN